MTTSLKALFDGRSFVPETEPHLEPGRTYRLRVEPDELPVIDPPAVLGPSVRRNLESLEATFAAIDAD